jgi:hypothetical protein
MGHNVKNGNFRRKKYRSGIHNSKLKKRREVITGFLWKKSTGE